MNFLKSTLGYRNGEWVPVDINGDIFGDNENCTDPKKLFEYVITQPSDLIIGIKYSFFKRSTTEKIHPNMSNEMWSVIDHDTYGRCYTVRPTLKMIHDGIKQVQVYLSDDAEVFFHTPGMFATAGQPTTFMTYKGRKYEMVLEHEVYNMLEFGGNPCVINTKHGHNKDKCAFEEVESKIMEKFGCTTPFGPAKENICTNRTIGYQGGKHHQDKTNFVADH